LTDAEQRYMRDLVIEMEDAQRLMAQKQAAVSRAVAFLREVHDAPEGEWTIGDLRHGFVPVKKDGKDGKKAPARAANGAEPEPVAVAS
jgi:hypothetical protein